MKGFTLLEALAVMAIFGVLLAIALPGFREYLQETRRNEGISFLLEIMQRQERYFTEELTYTVALTELGYATDAAVSSDGGYYEVSATACEGQAINRCVLLTATAVSVQASDGNLSLDSRGIKRPVNLWP